MNETFASTKYAPNEKIRVDKVHAVQSLREVGSKDRREFSKQPHIDIFCCDVPCVIDDVVVVCDLAASSGSGGNDLQLKVVAHKHSVEYRNHVSCDLGGQKSSNAKVEDWPA